MDWWVCYPSLKKKNEIGAVSVQGTVQSTSKPVSIVCMRNESVSRSVISDSLQAHGLLCPWGFPGKSTRVSSHSLLQRIFPTQGSSSGLLHCRQILYRLSHRIVSNLKSGHNGKVDCLILNSSKCSQQDIRCQF